MAKQITVSTKIARAVADIYEQAGAKVFAERIRETENRYGGDSVNISLGGLPLKALEALGKLLDGDKAASTYIKAAIRILQNPEEPFGRLEMLPEAFYRWMIVKAIDGWLYTVDADGQHVAWAVDSATYTAAAGSGDSYTSAYVRVKLVANGERSSRRSGSNPELTHAFMRFEPADVVQKSVPELVEAYGFIKETAELKAQYDADIANWSAWRALHNHQFVTVREVEQALAGDKFVNDEALIERNLKLYKSNDEWRKYGVGEADFTAVPVHPHLYVFDLRRDRNTYIHVSQLSPYVYDKTVVNKLVLPQEHRDLIDVLVQDMDVFVEDIVAGKSGGTAILCYGEPGLGKTLTAEVYSEIVERPLYKVHSGQLDVTAKSVEDNLKIILSRAERWGAVLLLDEADVYVARRGNDLNRNAVVASFLRTLEYFSGLMFLTTNRIDDVDDAIVSRMIALFHYKRPDLEMSDRLWRILAQQFDIELTDKQAEALVIEFRGLPGRDIKQLLRLVKKYCARKNVGLSLKVFRICAMFRGIDNTLPKPPR